MGSRVITMYQQQQMYQQQPMQQQQMQQTFRVVYPQGISWRASPNYNHKVTNMQGPLANTVRQLCFLGASLNSGLGRCYQAPLCKAKTVCSTCKSAASSSPSVRQMANSCFRCNKATT